MEEILIPKKVREILKRLTPKQLKMLDGQVSDVFAKAKRDRYLSLLFQADAAAKDQTVQMTKYLARACPRCGGYVDVMMCKPDRDLPVQGVKREDFIRFVFLAALLFLVAWLTSCTAVDVETEKALAPAAGIGKAIVCYEGCGKEWQRAQYWIVKHSRWKIQLANDVTISTYNPRRDGGYGFTATREPVSESVYTIRLGLKCAKIYGCYPNAEVVRKAFYYYVLHGEDLLPEQGFGSSLKW